MASFTVTKRKNKNSTRRQYDVKHPSFKSGKSVNLDLKRKQKQQMQRQRLIRDLEDGSKFEDNKNLKIIITSG